MSRRRDSRITEAFTDFTFMDGRDAPVDHPDQQVNYFVDKLRMLWISHDLEVPHRNKSVEEIQSWIARTAMYLAQESDPEHLHQLATELGAGKFDG